MASRTDVRYINAYVSGSAACKTKTRPAGRKPAPVARFRAPKDRVVAVDPVAIFGIAAAFCMIIALLAGTLALNRANTQARRMEEYVATLQEENVRLQECYDNGYDLDQVRQIALTMGMVSAEQVPHILVAVSEPQEEAEPSAWESFCTFLTGLFAERLSRPIRLR